MGRSVGIVGGGAAGMTAAITAARQGARVTLLEGNDRLGRKILSTGNGKCNLGNEKLDVGEYYTGRPDLLKSCLERFGTKDTIAFFQKMGLMIKSRNGYLYPMCEQAAAVLDVLRVEVRELGVQVVTECRVEQVEKNQDTGIVQVWGSGHEFAFDRLILACGGCAAPKTGSDGSGYRIAKQLGHRLTAIVPALVQLRCREDYFKAVAGVRADARLRVLWKGACVAEERGELQLTEYGISGIPVFQLSRVVNLLIAGGRYRKTFQKPGNCVAGEEVEILIDFFPDDTEESYERVCTERALLLGQRTAEEFFTGMLNKKLMMLFLRLAGLKPGEKLNQAKKEKVRRVYELCREWRIHVNGSNSFENAQVCAGGVPLDEVTENLESKKVPGVYFAGELLDVDGRCGGYNLQWAWTSGYLVGRAAALEHLGRLDASKGKIKK